MVIENLEVVNIFDCNLIERNEKYYINITNVGSSMKFKDHSFKLKSDTTIPFAIKTINHVVNANRKLILAENEANIIMNLAENARAFCEPIYTKFAVQDFFQENCA